MLFNKHFGTQNIALIVLSLLFLCSIYRLNQYVWTLSDNSQGPVVLLIVSYLFFVKIKESWPIIEAKDSIRSQTICYLFFFLGLLLYVVGRSQFINFIEISSFIFLIPSVIGLSYGIKVLKKFWFAIFFLIFLVPVPSFFVALFTMPIKIAVSAVTVDILSLIGYPVARSGVIMQIGQYQLLVADACAGMNTLLTLEGMGLFYLNLVKHDSFARNLIITLLIFPISFFANVVRVISISLVTYYFGDEVGQGFLHAFAGLVLFAVALLTVISIDQLIQNMLSRYKANG